MENYLKIEVESRSLEVIKKKDGRVEIEIDDPWEGDSETGFGATLHIFITKQQSLELSEFLKEQIS